MILGGLGVIIIIVIIPYNRHRAHVDLKTKVVQLEPPQNHSEHEIKETRENSHIGHCTQTLESTNVKWHNV